MKKIGGFICLLFILGSCGQDKVVKNEEAESNVIESTNSVENSVEVKVEETSIETKAVVIEKDDNLVTVKSSSGYIIEEEKVEVIKDFGNGLLLKEDINSKYVYFNGKKIKTLSKEKNLNGENKGKDFFLLSIGSRSFIGGNIIINLQNDKVYETSGGGIQKIELGSTGLYIIKHFPGGGSELSIITDSGKEKLIFEGIVIEDFNDIVTYIYDFELMVNKKIKVFYREVKGEVKKEIIIDLNDIL